MIVGSTARHPIRLSATPAKLSRTPAARRRGLGEHTEAVLAEAGFGADAIAALRRPERSPGRAADGAFLA